MASDLKGILLALRKCMMMEDRSNDITRSMALKINEAISIIEHHQLLNLSLIKEGVGWFWFIPGNSQEGFKGADLFVKKTKEKDKINFTLFMEFTVLGRVRMDVSIADFINDSQNTGRR